MKEKIICSAIYFINNKKYEHQPINIKNGYVITGLRHHNCFYINSLINEESNENIQGFLTSFNRFIDRKEGIKIALEADQIKENKEKLFSEDLY